MVGRFAKMSVLWATYFHDVEGADDALAAALGYGVATIYAILKGKAMPRKTTRSKGKKTTQKAAPQKPSLFDPPEEQLRAGWWQQYRSPAIPITSYLFYRRVRRHEIDDVTIWLGKEIPATDKYIAQIEMKFHGREHYMRHVEFARKLIQDVGEDKWLSKWYDVWKTVRDQDWELGQGKLFNVG